MSEDKTLELFGVDKETVEKSMDIKPVLDLSQMKDGETLKITFLDKEPKTIETPNSKFQKTSKVITVKDEENIEYSMFLSSKSLALGVAGVWNKNKKDLTNVSIIIKKGVANYKEHGENTVYNVQEL